jgi:hypothetical protein
MVSSVTVSMAGDVGTCSMVAMGASGVLDEAVSIGAGASNSVFMD